MTLLIRRAVCLVLKNGMSKVKLVQVRPREPSRGARWQAPEAREYWERWSPIANLLHKRCVLESKHKAIIVQSKAHAIVHYASSFWTSKTCFTVGWSSLLAANSQLMLYLPSHTYFGMIRNLDETLSSTILGQAKRNHRMWHRTSWQWELSQCYTNWLAL